jgi:hypothetical protein
MTPRQFAPVPTALTQTTTPLKLTVPKLSELASMSVKNVPCAGNPPDADDCAFVWKCAGKAPNGVGTGPFAAPEMKSLSGPLPFECVADARPGTRANARSDSTQLTSNLLIFPP